MIWFYIIFKWQTPTVIYNLCQSCQSRCRIHALEHVWGSLRYLYTPVLEPNLSFRSDLGWVYYEMAVQSKSARLNKKSFASEFSHSQSNQAKLGLWREPSRSVCKSKASLRRRLFSMMKNMHQYKQKRWKHFGFVPKINFFLLSLL